MSIFAKASFICIQLLTVTSNEVASKLLENREDLFWLLSVLDNKWLNLIINA